MHLAVSPQECLKRMSAFAIDPEPLDLARLQLSDCALEAARYAQFPKEHLAQQLPPPRMHQIESIPTKRVPVAGCERLDHRSCLAIDPLPILRGEPIVEKNTIGQVGRSPAIEHDIAAGREVVRHRGVSMNPHDRRAPGCRSTQDRCGRNTKCVNMDS